MRQTPRPRPGRPSRPLLAALTCLVLMACGGMRAGGPTGAESARGVVLSRTDISRIGGFTAMEVLERARTHLSIAHTREGRPARITHRGRASLTLAPQVLLVVDGSRVKNGVRMLESIPAKSIDYIQILSAREAALEWGSEAGNGVVVVRTSAY